MRNPGLSREALLQRVQVQVPGRCALRMLQCVLCSEWRPSQIRQLPEGESAEVENEAEGGGAEVTAARCWMTPGR